MSISGIGAAVSHTAEAVWATPAGVLVSTFIEIVSSGLVTTPLTDAKPSIPTGGAVAASGRICTGVDSGGQTAQMLTTEGLGVFWEHVMGVAATTAAAGALFSHTMLLQRFTLPGVTVQQIKGSDEDTGDFILEVFEGGVAGQVVVGFSVGQAATLTADWLCETSQARTTIVSGSPPTISVLQQASFIDTCDSLSIAWSGDTFSVNSATLTLNRNAARNRKYGQGLTGRPTQSPPVVVELQVTIDFDSNADYNDFLAAVEDDLVLTASKVIGGETHSIAFTLHDARISAHDGSPTSTGGRLTTNLTWAAKGTNATKPGLGLVVTNSSATFTAL